jgi:hypothetical protein
VGEPGPAPRRRREPDPRRDLRYFVGSSWVVNRDDKSEDITVSIDGTQYADGRVERCILVDQLHPDWPLNAGLARELISVLTAAVDEVDQMASRDHEV